MLIRKTNDATNVMTTLKWRKNNLKDKEKEKRKKYLSKKLEMILIMEEEKMKIEEERKENRKIEKDETIRTRLLKTIESNEMGMKKRRDRKYEWNKISEHIT